MFSSMAPLITFPMFEAVQLLSFGLLRPLLKVPTCLANRQCVWIRVNRSQGSLSAAKWHCDRVKMILGGCGKCFSGGSARQKCKPPKQPSQPARYV